MKYIFGPVNSRRFGVSLGIDLSPGFKSCNFDCLYCELEKNNPVDRINEEPPIEEILQEVLSYLNDNKHPDVITVTSNGEPTLYSKLDILVEKLNEIKGKSRTLILTNGSTINDKKIRKILSRFDMVKISLDTVNEKTFKKLDRPLEKISLQSIIDGIKMFRLMYSGELIVEVMVVKNINDSVSEMESIAKVLKEIKPDRVDIGTVDRPPAYRVSPVSDEKLFELSEVFEGLNINVITRGKDSILEKRSLTKEQIIKTLQRRPFTFADVEALFDRKTVQTTYTLLREGVLKTKKVGSVTFIYYD
ncbi:radical SAM protein [Persephonella sp.]